MTTTSYKVQCNRGNPAVEAHWRTVCSDRSGGREFHTLEAALRVFDRNAHTAQCVGRMRVVDSAGTVLAFYDSEQDTRLAGPRSRMLQTAAYYLWDKAGRPFGGDFWGEAQRQLKPNNGITIYPS